MKKTFKIGEYVVGGIIQVDANESSITINFKDYISKEIILTETFPINENTERNINFFIEDNGTAYYADKVTEWIKNNVELPQPGGWWGY